MRCDGCKNSHVKPLVRCEFMGQGLVSPGWFVHVFHYHSHWHCAVQVPQKQQRSRGVHGAPVVQEELRAEQEGGVFSALLGELVLWSHALVSILLFERE